MALAGEPFDPPDTSWTPVSPRLAALRRTVLAVVLGILTSIGSLVAWAVAGPAAVVGVVVGGVLLFVWGWVLSARNVASWRYTERDSDLLISHGVLFRQLVVVPYGRMQFVDVQGGPLERAFGLATVQLHTAAATTDARIPGLVPEEAARLRDRLASRCEVQSAGL